jgi:hypothetical protein
MSDMTRRRLILLATVLFGIVPATFTLLANALYYAQSLMAIPAGVAVNVIWGEVVMLCFVGLAGAAGYVALFFAARRRTTGGVAIALLFGVGALVYAMLLGLTPYWLGSPVLVGLAHFIAYFVRPGAADGGRRAA